MDDCDVGEFPVGTLFEFSLDYAPVPLARPRMGKGKRVYDSQKHTKLAMGLCLMNQFDKEPITQPIELGLVFYMPIPSSKLKIMKKCHTMLHACRPDLSNLIKMIEDVMVDCLILKDDSQVAIIHAEKRLHMDRNPSIDITVKIR